VAGLGADHLSGAGGADPLSGGAGLDECPTAAPFRSGSASATAKRRGRGGGDDIREDVEAVTGGSGSDVLIGDDDVNRLDRPLLEDGEADP